MWCIINLPNGTHQAVKWDPKAIGQDCLEKVCKSLDIHCEMEYFGLEYWSTERVGKDACTPQWINLRNRLSYDNSTDKPLTLALRVKFWVPIHFLLQENVRNLFYMQAKSDLLDGRLNARDWANAAKLSALICQADGLRFNKQTLQAKCPMLLKKNEDILLQQQLKEKKEKEYVLSLKKRRLSKQKSVDNIDICHSTIFRPKICHASTVAEMPPAAMAAALLSSQTSNPTLNASQEIINVGNEAAASTSLLSVYQNYIVRPANLPMPEDYLRQIATEHCKLSLLQMPVKSAKYWLLQEIKDLLGYGEEVFSGITTGENSTRCDISVGAHGITVFKGDDRNQFSIRFNAISAAKSFRRTFKLEYLDDHNQTSELEIKLPKHALAAGLYRSITERHAFYVCDKVRGVVTNQFTRDLKGTIASMFKEDTELGKRYVFDIQHTCREVHDHARRVLHERGVEFGTSPVINSSSFEGLLHKYMPINNNSIDQTPADFESSNSSINNSASIRENCMPMTNLDAVLQEKQKFESAVECCVDARISEAMTCKICMDNQINAMFNPCCHIMSCMECAARCSNCPNCRAKITSFTKIYLPTELRSNHLVSNISSSVDLNNALTTCGPNEKNSGQELSKLSIQTITAEI